MIRAILLVLLAAAAFAGASSLFMVHETRQALILQFGEPIRVIQEPGLNFKVPLVQNAVLIDNRILDLDTQPEEVLSSDQKRLIVDAFARFRIVDPLLYYQKVNNEAAARARLSTFLTSSVRKVLAEEEFTTLLSGERAALMSKIGTDVNSNAQPLGIEVLDVRIRRADLPQANSQAVFRRMQAERQREANEARAEGQEIYQRTRSRADRDVAVTLAEARRDAEIIRGEGDAQRNAIFAEAFGRDPDFFAFYRSMQAYEKALRAGDTTMVLSPDSEFFRYFENADGR